MESTAEELQRELRRIDGRGYKAYRDLQGLWEFPDFSLLVDHVQGDPFAAPSRLRVRVPQALARFPDALHAGSSRRIGLCDFLTRAFAESCRRHALGGRGMGSSGVIAIGRPGQEVLERSSMQVDERRVEARFVLGLPAAGRQVAGRQAWAMLGEELPRIVRAALYHDSLPAAELERHVDAVEDADVLRARLEGLGLVAFVADGALLPRRSGVDQRPMPAEEAIPFASPASLRVSVRLPHAGEVSGMGIPAGVTLVVGGGYHGKSTLLRALELGIYDHIPGDGRELVVSHPQAVKIRAEDGRRVEKVDISPFIDHLPLGRDTRAFSSEDASGSTSQAANIVEALEPGARLLLIDEDTSATNFMIRDHRMQELVAKEHEPITPFLDKVRQLWQERGVSTVLVIGGSGDYFDVADRVVCMVDYRPEDVTARARAIAEKYRAERRPEGGARFGETGERIPLAGSFDPSRGRRDVKISARGLHSIDFGTHTIDLSGVEQLVDPSQTRAIGDAILLATRFMDGRRTLREVIEQVMAQLAEGGLDRLSPFPRGDHAMFRGLELAAAVNRLRTLEVRSPGQRR